MRKYTPSDEHKTVPGLFGEEETEDDSMSLDDFFAQAEETRKNGAESWHYRSPQRGDLKPPRSPYRYD
jgi:hypothetical protein